MQIIKSKVRRLLKLLTGKVKHLKITVDINKKWYGNNYGGFYISPKLITSKSVVYSFGIGEDISFDNMIIEKHNCKVFGFDPTPKSIDWVKSQSKSLSPNFVLLEYGIADKSGMVNFFLPRNSKHVSGSFVKQSNVDDNQNLLLEMRSLADIIKDLDHKHIDVLKMDIEGAEYLIIDDILNSQIPIHQVLIEFHDRFFPDGKNKTIEAINKFKRHGYEVFGISDSFEEISFINKKVVI